MQMRMHLHIDITGGTAQIDAMPLFATGPTGRVRLVPAGLALATALAVAAAPALASLHCVLVKHIWCEEHQAFAHVDGEQRPTEPRTDRAPTEARYLDTTGPHSELSHAKCAGRLVVHEPDALLPGPTLVPNAAVGQIDLPWLDTQGLARAAPYRTAPKQSPPA